MSLTYNYYAKMEQGSPRAGGDEPLLFLDGCIFQK